MEFGLSEEQTQLQDTVNRYLNDASNLDAVRRFVEKPDQTVWTGLVELGVPGILVDDAAGGLGLSCLDAALIAEALGSHTAPAPFLGSAVMAPLALRLSGCNPDDLLSQLVSGSATVGIAFGEAVGARAGAGVRNQGGGLYGTALFVIDAGASHYLVADQSRALFLVNADASGLTRRSLTTIDRTRPTEELNFEKTPALKLTDDPEVFSQVLNSGRVMLAADTLGAAQNMLDQAVEYAKQREQFNRPIGSFQAVKHMCAEMAASLEPCRALVWYAAHSQDQVPDEATLMACHAKAHLAEVGTFVARTATEVHGGMGFTDLLGLHYWFKRIGWNRQLLGAPELVREEAARVQQLVA